MKLNGTKQLSLGLFLVAVIAVSGLCFFHIKERQRLANDFIQNQLDTVVNNKQRAIEGMFNNLYQNLRTISLLPSVRSITGNNRENDKEDPITEGRFTKEGNSTVQQIYNNLAANVSVSEVYGVLDGLDFTKGQIPFFMFDTLIVNDQAKGQEDGVKTVNPDYPEEDETSEYTYFPQQMNLIKQQNPIFNYSSLNAIPAYVSPLMRTCDNSQYQSKSSGDPHQTFGLLYSVPFYSEQNNQFLGVISGIIRGNAFEAALVGVPFIPVTDDDKTTALKDAWKMPDPARFILSNDTYDIKIQDRRNAALQSDMKVGVVGRNVFHITLNTHSDSPWVLSYYLPEAEIQAALSASDRIFFVLVLVILGVLAIAWVSLLLLTRLKTKLGGMPEDVASLVQAVSAGDLSINMSHIKGDNHVLADVKEMKNHLTKFVFDQKTTAELMKHESNGLLDEAHKLSASCLQQSNGTTSIAADIEELSVSVDNIADQAKEASNVVRETGVRAGESAHLVDNVTQEINIVAQSVGKSSDQIKMLGQKTQEISAIVTVIKEIADQTNLLALNAAIEAARAGDQGRGFAVVADEVRNLAKRTSGSTASISKMISEVSLSTNEIVETINQCVERVNKSVELTQSANSSMQVIQSISEQAYERTFEISQALAEQRHAAQDISDHIHNIAIATETNASSAEQVSNASEKLQKIAIHIESEVAFFKVPSDTV